MRRHAQRLHVVQSFDTLLYELYTLSYLLCPHLLGYICRLVAQYQFSRPREIDPNLTLRFWVFSCACLTAGSLGRHLTMQTHNERAFILDFVGRGETASDLNIILLDLAILIFQLVQVFIAFELPCDPDVLSASSSSQISNPPKPSYVANIEPILHLQWKHTWELIARPPPPSIDSVLPLPNTTRLFPLLRGPLRTFMRRRDIAPIPSTPTQDIQVERRVPGALDVG